MSRLASLVLLGRDMAAPRLRARPAPSTSQDGFTLIELLIVVSVIAILAAIALQMFVGLEQRARISRVQADLRSVASAVSLYDAHMGTPPATLDELTVAATNGQGQIAGPFLGDVPTRPSATWTPYSYVVDATAGTFTVSAAGDGATVSVP